MNSQEIIINTKPSNRKAILAYLLQLGYKWHGEEGNSVDYIVDEFASYPNIVVLPNRIRGTTRSGMDFSEVIDRIPGPIQIKKVILNHEYTAEVHKDHVEVGCQTFTHDKIKELAKAVEEISR